MTKNPTFPPQPKHWATKGPLFEIDTNLAGKEPCGECHIQPGETCDICGASSPSPQPNVSWAVDLKGGIEALTIYSCHGWDIRRGEMRPDQLGEGEWLHRGSVMATLDHAAKNESQMRDALKNLLGIYDTPLSRRRFPPDDFMNEALSIARDLLAELDRTASMNVAYEDALAASPPPPQPSKDRAETAVVAANALQARLDAAEAALREQVDACDADDCEMCHRHRAILRARNHGGS